MEERMAKKAETRKISLKKRLKLSAKNICPKRLPFSERKTRARVIPIPRAQIYPKLCLLSFLRKKSKTKMKIAQINRKTSGKRSL